MKKAIALIRTSTTNQEVEQQKKEVLQMCYIDGLKNDEIIVVGGKGASAIKQDDAYKKNIEKVFEYLDKIPSIKTVYCFAVDRIGRVMSTLSLFRENLVERHIQLVIKEPVQMRLFNSKGEEDKIVEQQFYQYAFYARVEMEIKKARMLTGRYRNKELGLYNGSVVKFGYNVNPITKKFEINKEEADIIRLIFELLASDEKRYTLRKVTKELNDRGIRKRGRVMTFRTISRIAKDVDYTGEGSNIRPQIISKNLFDKVRKRLNENNTVAPKQYKHYYFGAKIVRCIDCDSCFSASSGVYRCNNYVEYNINRIPTAKTCGNGINIKISYIDAALWCATRDEYFDFLKMDREQIKRETEKKIKILQEKILENEKQISNVDIKRKRIANAYIDEIINEDEYKTKLSKLNRDIKDAQNEILMQKEEIKRLEKSITIQVKDDSTYRIIKATESVQRKNEKEMCDLVHRFIKKMTVSEMCMGNNVYTKSEEYNLSRQRGYYFKIIAYTGNIYEFYYLPWIKCAEKYRLFEYSEEYNCISTVSENRVIDYIRYGKTQF